MTTIHYHHIERFGLTTPKVIEVPDESLEEFFAQNKPCPLAIAVTHSGFPPENWAACLGIKVNDIYNHAKGGVINSLEYARAIKIIVGKRRQNNMICDSL